MLKRLSLLLVRREFISNPIQRFELSILVLILLTLGATLGYMLLEEMTFTDALYMTVITITTVGFGEVRTLSPEGRLFTIGLIILGVGAATAALSNAVGIVVGPLLWSSIRKRNMERQLIMMKDHYIVCGYGRMGSQIIHDLQEREKPFVLIDSNPTLEAMLIKQGVPYIIGDATHDETLQIAGIERARGLVAALSSDANNVMTVLTARELNSRLYIVARVSQSDLESKLRRAGANEVISPYQIGGHRIALALIRPAVNTFLENIFRFEHGNADTDIGQLYIYRGASLAGTTIATCGLRDKHNISVLAIIQPNGELIITPNPLHELEPGATVIVIGPPENVYALERDYERRT